MEIRFAEVNSNYYLYQMIDTYEKLTGRTIYPADPERVLFDVFSYVSSLLAFSIDYSAKQNLLSYATGQYLDGIAELYGIQRLQPKPALTTIRFSTQQPATTDILIPVGTRVAAGDVVFRTTKEAIIKANTTFVDVQAECETSGSVGNGFLPGQVNTLLDFIANVEAQNIDMSLYGVDEEDDERFRERIRLSIERFSNAGSREAYIYHTKTAHQLIEDVEAFSPAPGTVNIYFLLKNGELPNNDMIQLVRTHLSDEKIRPLTDMVVVSAPEVVHYQIDLVYYIHKKDEARVNLIQQKIETAINDFITWTGSKIGRDVLPEELIRRLKDAGAYRVILNSPNYQEISNSQVAKCNSLTINYQGLVND